MAPGEELDQVPPEGVDIAVGVAGMQKEPTPEIDAGVDMTVTTLVVKQPEDPIE
jgi:hypothetical protein